MSLYLLYKQSVTLKKIFFIYFFLLAGSISSHAKLSLQITDAVLLSSGFIPRRHFKKKKNNKIQKPGCGYAECCMAVLVAAVFSESAGKQL